MSDGHDLRTLALLRRARDAMDRDSASPLDVPTVAGHAFMSPAHFSRRFRAAYGQTPYDYLMSRRVERAMALPRGGSTVTDACCAVGYTSLGSFTQRFTSLVGETPSSYRERDHRQLDELPACLTRTVTRPVGRASSSSDAEQDRTSRPRGGPPIVRA